jgi:hypothetical protein
MKNTLQHIILRDELMKATRAFFAERKFCEVIPPILNIAIPNEPNLYPFATSWVTNDAEETRYLPTSPERSLKIALSAGLGDCYAIGHCFRNLEGSGSLHSPEFRMLEWYRVNSSYQEIMKEIQEYIAFVNKQLLPFGAKSLEESLSVDQPSLRPCPQCSRICEAGGETNNNMKPRGAGSTLLYSDKVGNSIGTISLSCGIAASSQYFAPPRNDKNSELQTFNPRLFDGQDTDLNALFTLRISCGSGTYMRQLVMDIGEKINIPICAFKIKRTRVGEYRIGDCVS